MDEVDGNIVSNTDTPRSKVQKLLSFYLRKAWENVGLTWDQDNETEIEEIVEAFAEMVHEENTYVNEK